MSTAKDVNRWVTTAQSIKVNKKAKPFKEASKKVKAGKSNGKRK